MYYPRHLENSLDSTLSIIHKSAKKAGRNPNNINIVAVTKTLPVEAWNDASRAHLDIIGENRVQEAQEKFQKYSNSLNMHLHLIGHLQSNKVNTAVKLFDVIQTIDSIKLAEKINTVAEKQYKKQNIFIQINISADPKKHGFTTKETLIATQKISEMQNIKLLGIMVIPKQNLSIDKLKDTYSKTRKLRDVIQKKINQNCKNISMGMSKDYTIAISEGATHIRLGTALFGPRTI